jgi:hypothetical protein
MFTLDQIVKFAEDLDERYNAIREMTCPDDWLITFDIELFSLLLHSELFVYRDDLGFYHDIIIHKNWRIYKDLFEFPYE